MVKIPAEAHAFKTKTIAEGMKIKSLAEALASCRSNWKSRSTSMILEALPHLAGEVASLLKRTKEIVVMGGEENRTNRQVTSSYRLLQEWYFWCIGEPARGYQNILNI